MRHSFASSSRFVALAVAGAAVVVLTECKKSTAAPPPVASTNVTIPVTKAIVPALEGTTMTFANAGAALDPSLANQTFSVTFTNTSAATPTATFTIPGINGSFTADVTFGSCIFTLKTVSNLNPNLKPGTVLTVSPCTLTVNTNGVVADGQNKTTTIQGTFGSFVAGPNTGTVSIDPSGAVTFTTPSGVKIPIGTVGTRPGT